MSDIYTILIKEDNSLIATHKTAIMQHSKLVDELLFLCPKMYNNEDMSTYTSVTLEYLSPATKQYRTDCLSPLSELYKEHIQYKLPVDTKITFEAGDVQLQITFIKTEMDADTGKPFEHVRKTKVYQLKVIPIANWSQFVPDDALTAIDKRIAELSALQNGAINIIDDTKTALDKTYSSQKIEDLINSSTGGSDESSIIDDTLVSTDKTYSSQMIEDKFIDTVEINEAIDEARSNQPTITTEDIDSLFS